MGKFWPKRAIFQIFLKNQSHNIFCTAEAKLPAKKLGNSNAQFSKKMLKIPFLGILGQKGRFWTIFGQKGAIFEFSVKKRKRHFFTPFFSFFNTKNQKILMRGFSGKKARTYGRMYGRTKANPKVHRLRRETKKTYPKRFWLVKKIKRNLSRKNLFF